MFLGAQAVVGNPLGAPATWAGEMAFLGNVIETKEDDKGVKRKVMLSTAEPAEQPRFLRSRLNIAERRRPQILVLDTGLETVEQNGTRQAKHDFLDCCIVDGATWRSSAPKPDGTFPVDDEDEPDDDKTGTLDFEGGRHVHRRGDRAVVPGRRDSHGGSAVEFRRRRRVRGDRRTAEGLAATTAPIDIVVMSFGAFFADDDPGIFGSSLVQLLGNRFGVARRATRQPADRTSRQGSTKSRASAPSAWAVGRGSRTGRLGRRLRPGVDVVSTFFDFSEDLSLFPPRRAEAADLPGLGALERHELLGAEGCRRPRSGDVPQPQRRRNRPHHGPGGVAGRSPRYNHLRRRLYLGVVFNV